MNTSAVNSHIDKVPIGLSALCAVHCLVLPFVVGVMPALGGAFILATAHARNFRRCRPADGCHKGAC